MIRWHDLQMGLAEQLPHGVFHLGHQFEGLTQDEECVTVSFKVAPSMHTLRSLVLKLLRLGIEILQKRASQKTAFTETAPLKQL